MNRYKKGIALLITLFFIMAITVSIGLSLKYVDDASNKVQDESFLFQSRIVLDDVLKILKNSKELEAIESESDLYYFLSQSRFISLESSGLNVNIEINSARSKFNPNILSDSNKTVSKENALREYMSRYMINNAYVDILLDNMRGIKEDSSYNSDIFIDKPYLFRDYIVSSKHLDEINEYFIKTYHDDSLKNIDLQDLFYFSPDKDIKIDVNYATPLVWEMTLGVDKQRAEILSLGSGSYKDEQSLNLSKDEQFAFKKFKFGFFEQYLDVKLLITQDTKSANIRFEYDIKNKKGSNFSYEI